MHGPRGRNAADWRTRFDGSWKRAESGCWEWIGCITRDGYGQISIDSRNRMAHRVAYELYVGPIAHGLHLDHLCRNRRCICPDHLQAVTPQVNFHRSTSPFRPKALFA